MNALAAYFWRLSRSEVFSAGMLTGAAISFLLLWA